MKFLDRIAWLAVLAVTIVLIASLTFLKTGKAAAAQTESVLIEMRAAQLTKWVADATGYKPSPPPPIIYMDAATMQRVTKNPNIRAIYFPNMIVLGDHFRLGEHDYILVHELVHHLQFMSGRLKYEHSACYSALEIEAYGIQRRWVEETGIGDFPDGFSLFVMFGNCHAP